MNPMSVTRYTTDYRLHGQTEVERIVTETTYDSTDYGRRSKVSSLHRRQTIDEETDEGRTYRYTTDYRRQTGSKVSLQRLQATDDRLQAESRKHHRYRRQTTA